MKKNIISVLESLKLVISVTLVLAVLIGVWGFLTLGKDPVVSIAGYDQQTNTSELNLDSVDLAFPKAGRLASVKTAVGTQVRKGEVLASLDAGDALGALTQAQGALELAKAQYASMDVQYANAKKQQDVLVENAYRTMLSSGLVAVSARKDPNGTTLPVDNNQAPQISGIYTCNKPGVYEIYPYASGVDSGYSYTYSGLEKGNGNVTYYTPQPLGACGLYVQFPVGYHVDYVKWVIEIPNTKSSTYTANKNAYDLAVTTRDQVLSQLEANLGKNGSSAANVAQAAVDSARGVYQTALANYQNTQIIAPMDGVVSFVDSHLKVGQSIPASKTVITISKK